jgi:hypothetical protein
MWQVKYIGNGGSRSKDTVILAGQVYKKWQQQK